MTDSTRAAASWKLRPATSNESDIFGILRVFVAGIAVSLPDRNLAEEGDYIRWERDVVPVEGRLHQRILKQLRDERVCVVVEPSADGQSDTIIGYVSYAPANPENDFGEITYCFVDPAQHGRGLGSALVRWSLSLAQAEATTREDKRLKVVVKCFSRNVAGIRLYTRAGFKSVSEENDETVNEKWAVLELIL